MIETIKMDKTKFNIVSPLFFFLAFVLLLFRLHSVEIDTIETIETFGSMESLGDQSKNHQNFEKIDCVDCFNCFWLPGWWPGPVLGLVPARAKAHGARNNTDIETL